MSKSVKEQDLKLINNYNKYMTVKNTFTDKELIAYRKTQFKRGFTVACICMVPVIAFFVFIINKLISVVD